MLRDKFIHYFQQWRERQLSRGEHWLAQHLAGRSPREKGMLLAAVVFLFSVGYYVLIWQPLSERIEQQETMLQQLVAMNTRLRSAAPDIIAARKSATTTPAQVSRVISDSASAHSVVIKRIAERGENIQVWIDPVVFNDLLNWLNALDEKYALRVTQIDASAAEKTGMVNVQRLEFGHFFGASAGHLEKDDELVGAHPADGERTGPGHIERPALRTEHDELSRRPTLPIGPFEAQGKKTSLRSGEPEGNIINNRQVVKRGLTHVRTSCLIQVLWSFVVCMPPYGQGAREVFCNSLEFRRDGCSGFV